MFTFKLLVVLMLIGPVQIEIPNLTKAQCDEMPSVATLLVDPQAIVAIKFECVEQGKQDHQWDEKPV